MGEWSIFNRRPRGAEIDTMKESDQPAHRVVNCIVFFYSGLY